MYSDFKTISTYYDALYVNDREYAPEAAKVKELLTKHGVPSRAELLVLACGTGGISPTSKTITVFPDWISVRICLLWPGKNFQTSDSTSATLSILNWRQILTP